MRRTWNSLTWWRIVQLKTAKVLSLRNICVSLTWQSTAHFPSISCCLEYPVLTNETSTEIYGEVLEKLFCFCWDDSHWSHHYFTIVSSLKSAICIQENHRGIDYGIVEKLKRSHTSLPPVTWGGEKNPDLFKSWKSVFPLLLA